MRFDFYEQIPEGLMDRVEQRLATHLAVKKKKRVMKTLALLSVCLLLIPATVYGFVNNDIQSWYDSIRIASNRGKTVKLNYDFEYEKNKIVFEDAVWEENELLVSFRIVDGMLWPSKFSLLNDKDEVIGHSGGYSINDENEGTLRFNFEEEEITGDKVFLSVEALEKLKFSDDDIDYKYKLNIDKEFLATGQAKVGKTFETEYGFITIEEIKIKDGRTFLTYKYDRNDKMAKISEQDKLDDTKLVIFIKDSENNVLKSNLYIGKRPSDIEESELFGNIKNLDNSLEVAIECNEIPVNWKAPVKIKNTASKVIEVNKDIKIDSGTLRISEIVLKSASTRLNYEFIPSKGYENTIYVSPLIDITLGGKRYISTKRSDGRLEFPVVIDKKDLRKVKLNVHAIYRYEERNEKFTLTKGDVPTSFVVDGVKFNIENMEIKDGKTYIDILVDGQKREFTNFDITTVRKKGEKYSVRVHGELEFADKSIEPKYNDEPYSFDKSILETIKIRKNMKINGEFDTVDLELDCFEYLDICNAEIKIK